MQEVTTLAGVKELNQPTAAQRSETPDATGNVDFYKRLDADAPKAVDWRRKLGGMAMHLLGNGAKEFAGVYSFPSWRPLLPSSGCSFILILSGARFTLSHRSESLFAPIALLLEFP